MHPLLEKLMLGGCLISGLCVGSIYLNRWKEKTIEDMLKEEEGEILKLDAEKDSKEYKEWEKLVEERTKDMESLKVFLSLESLNTKNPGYEDTISKLIPKCRDLLSRKIRERNGDYENAKKFCTGLK